MSFNICLLHCFVSAKEIELVSCLWLVLLLYSWCSFLFFVPTTLRFWIFNNDCVEAAKQQCSTVLKFAWLSFRQLAWVPPWLAGWMVGCLFGSMVALLFGCLGVWLGIKVLSFMFKIHTLPYYAFCFQYLLDFFFICILTHYMYGFL